MGARKSGQMGKRRRAGEVGEGARWASGMGCFLAREMRMSGTSSAMIRSERVPLCMRLYG